jgi:GNAT superfamily N-acetyltransferase
MEAAPDGMNIRPIRSDELAGLLNLYCYLHPSDPEPAITANLEELWNRICADPNLHYLVGEIDGRLVSTCTLTIIPNLTRGARPYGLIENVVTHPEYRRRGLGTSLLHRALQMAWEHSCYKVMLLTGRKDEATLRFYEQAGFEGGVKTGFVARP